MANLYNYPAVNGLNLQQYLAQGQQPNTMANPNMNWTPAQQQAPANFYSQLYSQGNALSQPGIRTGDSSIGGGGGYSPSAYGNRASVADAMGWTDIAGKPSFGISDIVSALGSAFFGNVLGLGKTALGAIGKSAAWNTKNKAAFNQAFSKWGGMGVDAEGNYNFGNGDWSGGLAFGGEGSWLGGDQPEQPALGAETPEIRGGLGERGLGGERDFSGAERDTMGRDQGGWL